jgi:histidinol phosphatase-like PHP family hydrolase
VNASMEIGRRAYEFNSQYIEKTKAEKHNIILEINLMEVFKHMCGKLNKITYPNREFWRIVSEYNVPVMYGIDAHFIGQIRSREEMIKFTRAYLGKDIVSKLNFVEDYKLK